MSVLKGDLNVIKGKLNLLLKQKDHYGDTILHDLLLYNKNLDTIKYVFDYTKINHPELFFSKNNSGNSILYNLLNYNDKIEIIEYVLDFTKDNFPNLFLEKDNNERSFLSFFIFPNKDFKIKYVFDFLKNNCPNIFSEKDINGDTIFHLFVRFDINDSKITSNKTNFVLNFIKINCPIVFLEKNKDGNIFLHDFLCYNEDLNLIKNVLYFFKSFPQVLKEIKIEKVLHFLLFWGRSRDLKLIDCICDFFKF